PRIAIAITAGRPPIGRRIFEDFAGDYLKEVGAREEEPDFGSREVQSRLRLAQNEKSTWRDRRSRGKRVAAQVVGSVRQEIARQVRGLGAGVHELDPTALSRPPKELVEYDAGREEASGEKPGRQAEVGARERRVVALDGEDVLARLEE